jgi:hypothetical protein
MFGGSCRERSTGFGVVAPTDFLSVSVLMTASRM